MSVSPVPGASFGVAARDGDATVGPRTTFVLGGARSGKSRFAESFVTAMAADTDRNREGVQHAVQGGPAPSPDGEQDQVHGDSAPSQTHDHRPVPGEDGDGAQGRCLDGIRYGSGRAESASEQVDPHSAGALSITYIATSARVLGDVAFAERIALHQVRRPASWGLIEADHDLAGALRQADAAGHGIVLIDCLTLWLTRLLCPMDAEAPRPDWEARLADFDKALAESRSRVVLVSNEIGLGVVPMGSVTRLFVDELGRLNQRIAAACDHVVLTVAGLPLVLKDGAAQVRQDAR